MNNNINGHFKCSEQYYNHNSSVVKKLGVEVGLSLMSVETEDTLQECAIYTYKFAIH